MLVKLVINNALLCQQCDLIDIKKEKKKKYVYDVLLNAFMEEAERNKPYLKKNLNFCQRFVKNGSVTVMKRASHQIG